MEQPTLCYLMLGRSRHFTKNCLEAVYLSPQRIGVVVKTYGGYMSFDTFEQLRPVAEIELYQKLYC